MGAAVEPRVSSDPRAHRWARRAGRFPRAQADDAGTAAEPLGARPWRCPRDAAAAAAEAEDGRIQALVGRSRC
eukprot:CAMPEP_0176104172 /NCGR_PEP_ID=MMETSP0120_2-20121206/52269_1 /TAXON_ID=160619 /ORGANISM="Kryptoperidinium foliaceum, Strain CCMP 1326" /LENGTH=72 /DNA_ID=CAMNT_0017438271 /DNA_START=44 /DNA_END=259 /DNA_ORIENTATION=+